MPFRLPSEKALSKRLMKALMRDATEKDLGVLLMNEQFAKAFTTELKKQLKPLLKTVTKKERKELKRFLKDLKKHPHQTLARQYVREMLNPQPLQKSLLGKALPYILSAGAGAAVTGGIMMALQSEQNSQYHQ